MDKEDLVCEVCDSEFTVEHFEEDEVCFCPFCGESLYSADWADDEADKDDDEE